MSNEKIIKVNHVTRIEGHGNIHVKIKNGNVEACQWQITEAPRFFEAMVRGRKWNEVAHITSRICGICSIGHTLASLKATEAAMRIEISEQTKMLRRILLHAENIQSHVLHLGYLVLPDLLRVPSVVPLVATHQDAVKLVVRLHRLANEMSDKLGGRTTHPQRPVVGGFAKWPQLRELEEILKGLEGALQDVRTVADLFKSLQANFPSFSRETEFIALTHPTEYSLYEGRIASTDGGTWPVDQYLEITNEYLVPWSTAKFTRHKRDAYMVGALARFNLNYPQLTPLAREIAKVFGLQPINYNPFMNNIAQLIEVVQSFDEAIQLLRMLLDKGLKDEKPAPAIRAGRGAGAIEVPRGILFHEYEYNQDGECTFANCIIPTNQNHGNIQKDFEAWVPRIKDLPAKEIELMLEMLVRAYDPCVSCSTH